MKIMAMTGTGGILVAVLLTAGTAAGQTVYWKGGVDTAWSNPANWANAADGSAMKPGPGVSVVVDLRANPKNMPVLDLAKGSETIGSLLISGGTASATLTLANGDVSTKMLVVTGDVTIGANGVLTHAAETATGTTVGNESNRLCVVVGGNLNVLAGGQINVDGKGYAGNCGPGRGIGNLSGGGHGGEGGGTAPGGTTYGSITNPATSGSGGHSAQYSGGGTVVLRAGGTFTHNGVITANGQNRGGAIGGAGAGGSINVTAGTMAGTSGTLSANGGCGAANNGTGAGGGGRIALVVTNAGATIPASLLTNTTAVGGQGDGGAGIYGAAGTIYLKTAAQSYGDLIVNNLGIVPSGRYTFLHDATYRFDSITTTNQGGLLVGTNAALTLDGCVLRSDSTIHNVHRADANGGQYYLQGSRLVAKDNGQLNWTGTWTNNGTISWWGTSRTSGLTVGNLTVAAGGILTHETINRPANCLMLVVNGDLTVDAGGAIWAKGLGYLPGQPYSGSGNAGGVHGGEGGWGGGGGTPGVPTTPTYGSITNPTTAGGGSAGAYPSTGGGAVIVRVSRVVTINGTINAMGDAAQVSGGAGGSVSIRAGQLQGSGSITADGGIGQGGNTGGGGGGGRIAVVLANDATFGNVAFSAAGGANLVEGASGGGAAGTIYLQGPGSAYGLLIVSNGVPVARATNVKTLISPLMTDAVVGDVRVLGQASLAVDAGRVFEVYGNWSSDVPDLTVSRAGNVEFKGGATSTISGSTTFNNLKCVVPGKTLQFEGGSTQSVSGRLTLAGAEGKLLALKPAAPGTRWKLNAVLGSTHDVRCVQVSDSDAIAVDPILGFDSDGASAKNDNWAFGAATNAWTGSESTAWDARQNWSLGRLPTYVDTVVIPRTSNTPELDSDRVIGGLNLDSGAVLALNNRTLCVRGDVRNAGSISGAGTFRLTGATAQNVMAGGNSFDILDVGNTGTVTFADSFTAARFGCRVPGAELVFSPGGTATIGVLDLLGAPGKLVKIRSSLPTAVAKWNLTGHAVVYYADVSDQDASGGYRICAIDSTGNGHTPNWDFAPKHCRGGVETEKFIGDLKYRIHTFTNSGILKVNRYTEVEYLIVAGGGGGGHNNGGGGGAGGLLYGSTNLPATNYTITVGAGGVGSVYTTATKGSNGGNTSVSNATAAVVLVNGGGGGGARQTASANDYGLSGGSGGGAGGADAVANGGAGTPPQGFNGGTNMWVSSQYMRGAGGGGAGGVGGNSIDPSVTGAGGAATNIAITGTSVAYAQGGAGGGGGVDGLGGGATGTAGLNGTGGGGGGGKSYTNGGRGGDGIVVVRYKLDIHNRPVSNVTLNGATFNAYLVRANPAPARVSVLWGEDNGVASGAWAHTNSWKAGEWGANSRPGTNMVLTANRSYYYTFEVTCGTNREAADVPVNFITGAVEVRATRRESTEEKPAAFVISRPATATNGPLVVYYTLVGTGRNGEDYDKLQSPAIIPSGETEVRLSVVPNFNMGETRSKGVELTIQPGAYLIGVNGKASIVTKAQ
jgi:hypothetical protein